MARLGSESVATDFLGKLREMTGGQVVAVTRDKVHSKSEDRSEEVKVNMIDAEQVGVETLCSTFIQFC